MKTTKITSALAVFSLAIVTILWIFDFIQGDFAKDISLKLLATIFVLAIASVAAYKILGLRNCTEAEEQKNKEGPQF